MKRQTYLKEFIRYTSFNILGMAGLSCYILADTFFISKALGAEGLTALNLAIPVYSVLHGCGLMLGVGGAAKYSILKGQGAVKSGNLIFTNTLYATALFAVLFSLAGIFLSGNITALMGADNRIFQMTNTYLKVILLFSPAFLANDVLLGFVRNDGSPRLSMLAMVTGSLSNVALDYIFLFPFQLGMFGAVLATGLAPVISICILSTHFRKKERFRLERTKPSLSLIAGAFSLGFPSLITEASCGVVMLVFNMIILRSSGNTGVAAYGIIANLSLVVLSVFTGIAQGMQPLASAAYGHSDKKGTLQLLQYAISTALGLSLAIYFFFALSADSITGIFNSGRDMRLQALAVRGLKLYFLAIPFAGFNAVLSMFFAATQRALPAQLLSLLRGIVLIIPTAIILSRTAGLTGVWLSFPVAEALTAVVGLTLFLRSRR